jgi:phage shock protein A
VGFWSRLRAVFGAKANKALDRIEDPRDALDYSYQKQLGLLTDVKRGLAEVATSKQRLRLQAAKLQEQDDKLQSQAQQAVAQDREDLARMALQRRQVIQPQIQNLQTQVTQLDDQQEKLSQASQQLQSKIEMFRTQKETMKAQYTASSAQVKINESFTGLSSEMTSIGTTLQRAQDRIEQMQARSGALDELIDSGTLTDYTAQLTTGQDDIDRQLALGTGAGSGDEVDRQIAAMKAQLPAGDQKALESGEEHTGVKN